MTKDRIEELRAESANTSQKYKISGPWSKESQEETVRLTSSYKLPTIGKSSKKEQESLDAVFKEVNLVLSWIESIKEETVMLRQCHRMAHHSTRTDASTKDKIQELMSNIRNYSRRAREGLEGLKKRKEKETENGIRRVIETQHAILNKSYTDAIGSYQVELVAYKKRNEDIIKKHLLIVLDLVMKRLPIVPADKEVTTEQLTSMLDSEDTAVFADDYLKDTAFARQQLQEVQIRHNEILAIEKEITEIKNLFFDIAYHVQAQGELIDRIDYHIRKGVDRAQGGTERLAKAMKKRARARKTKITLMVCLFVVLAIIFLFLLVHFSF